MDRLWLKLLSFVVLVALATGCDSDGAARLAGNVTQSQATPVVTSFTPNPAQAGQRVIIHGTNFGSDPSAVAVTFGGTRGVVLSVSDGRIEANVPASLAAGSHPVRVAVAGRSSTASSLMVEGEGDTADEDLGLAPVITTVIPGRPRPGQRVMIEGRNFGTRRDAVGVTFDGEPANVVSVADSRIEADVPSSLEPGPATLTVTVDGRSASSALTIDPASVDGGPGGEGTGGDGSAGGGGSGDGSGGDGSGDGSGGGGSGDEAPDVSGTYDVDAGVASNSCPADFSLDAAGLAANDAVVTQDDSSVTTDMGGGLRFTDDRVSADGQFDASNGNDRLQQDFSEGAFTGTLTRDLGLCSVTFSLQGTKR
jgi:hypothetical protein